MIQRDARSPAVLAAAVESLALYLHDDKQAGFLLGKRVLITRSA